MYTCTCMYVCICVCVHMLLKAVTKGCQPLTYCHATRCCLLGLDHLHLYHPSHARQLLCAEFSLILNVHRPPHSFLKTLF